MIIVGAMRSGTTSLARYLGEHPEVFMAAAKEVRFFDRHHDRGVEWYEQHFAEAGERKIIGEATPNYIYEEQAIARMAGVVPHARLLAILRHPVDRLYSHYWHRRALGRESHSLQQIVDAEVRPAALPAGGGSDGHRYLDRSLYFPQLQTVCRYYPREALHVLLFEDLRDHPRAAYAGVCRFLGIDETVVPSNLGRRINRFREWRSVTLVSLGRRLPGPVAKAMARIFSRETEYPPMDPHLRATLLRHYAQDVSALATWLGRDLSGWTV